MARIALAIPSLAGGGAERTVLTIARGLLAREHRVDLVLFRPHLAYPNELPASARLFLLSTRPPRTMPPAAEWQGRRASSLNGLKLAARLIREFERPQLLLRGRLIVRALLLHRYAERQKPDILFSNLGPAELAALYAGIIDKNFPPVVPVVHGAYSARHMRRCAMLFPAAAHIVAVSRGLAGGIAHSTNTPRDRVSTIYNPTDLSDVRRQATEAVDHPWFTDDGPPVVLSAGRLDPIKDFLTLIEAFRRLLSERPCRLVLLGEGPCRKEIEQRIGTLGLESHVSLPGWAENPFAFMARARLFVLSSISEGLGNVLVEAMACGCPAVATNCPGGVAEVLRDPGLLAPVGDPDALARVMSSALDRPIDQAALRDKTAPFTMGRAIDQYEAVIAGAARS